MTVQNFVDSTRTLKDLVLTSEGELEQMVASKLDALVAEINAHQEQLRQACLSYRASIPEHPTEKEFYEFFDLLREMSSGFHPARMNTQPFEASTFQSWRERSSAPKPTIRRNTMLILLDDAMEKAILSGVEVLREMLRNHDGSSFPASWCLGPPRTTT